LAAGAAVVLVVELSDVDAVLQPISRQAEPTAIATSGSLKSIIRGSPFGF